MKIILFFVTIILTISRQCVTDERILPENIHLSGGIVSGNIEGDTAYRIDFPSGTSQLEFPLDSTLFGFEFGINYKSLKEKNYDKSKFNIRLLTAPRNNAGKMKDSDWLTDATDISEVGSAHPGLDIYSESTAKLSALIMDINYIYNIFSTKKITFGLSTGYLYERFEYSIYDLEQVGFGPYAAGYTGNVAGKVLDYEVNYYIPYVGLDTNILLDERFLLSLQWDYSGLARASDRDDHILRNKIAEGNCNGNASIISLNAVWQVQPKWDIQLAYTYINIKTKGKQSQFWYGDDPASPGYDDTGDSVKGIDDKISSSQKVISVTVRYRF